MSEKDQKDQAVEGKSVDTSETRVPAGKKAKAPSREERLAEALRANLRRRKSAAKAKRED
ncbi:hypothetical protein [Roseibium sp. MMSF_3544]|uniref:hypothetical protein n=1 Tax=unclassified Roseibium TaxID=2629323 RepID=UPI00273D529E|nr:hypothetical protein [Roseibium sp. MMSF_3544]